MVDIICGERGQGKTKEMLQRANDSVADAKGAIVYIDKSRGVFNLKPANRTAMGKTKHSG